MGKISNKSNLRKLKLIENELILNYNKNMMYKKLYESSNKSNKNEDIFLITNEYGRNLLSEIPKDNIDCISEIEKFDKNIFDPNNNTINIKTYIDVLKTVRYLINIIEYDLCEAFAVDSLINDPTRIENVLNGKEL